MSKYVEIDLPGHRPDWHERAACRGKDPAIFFSVKGDNQSVQEAKAICGNCTVRDLCEQDAIDRNDPYGVWGGLTIRERREVRRNRGMAGLNPKQMIPRQTYVGRVMLYLHSIGGVWEGSGVTLVRAAIGNDSRATSSLINHACTSGYVTVQREGNFIARVELTDYGRKWLAEVAA